LLTAKPVDDSSLQRRRIEGADPRHFESACLNRYPAHLTEQVVAIAHAYDYGIDAAQHCVDAIEAAKLGFR